MGVTHNFLSFWVIFYPSPLLTPKIKNFKKIRRYFLFRMCTINKDSCDIRHNRQKFLLFWLIFCPFIPLTKQKIKTLKNEKKKKKNLEIVSFQTRVTKIMIICYTGPEIWRMMAVIFIFYFELLFALLKHLEI